MSFLKFYGEKLLQEMTIPREQVDESVPVKKMILKCDHFPGCQNKLMSPQIEGAPNYRQADSLHVHGVAIPTATGIRNVLRHIGAHKDCKQVQVLWISLREEPVVYINGRPFAQRDAEEPFTNLEYTGINRVRVEQMEARLKEDILMEASRYGDKILVTDELPNGEMVNQLEPVSIDSLKTVLEVYEELQAEGYLLDYERVPEMDDKSPKETDFDTLVRKISQADINTEIIFNCQMGHGRTTTGMVIATLVYLKRKGASDQGFTRNNSFGRFFTASENVTINLPNIEEALPRGEYTVVSSLIRVLEGGVEGKRQVDKVIDKCSSMQNLREAIAIYRNSILRQPDEKKREAALSFFVEYLERYYFFICFAVYLHSEGAFLQSGSLRDVSFADWMRARPELCSILHSLLKRDPMGALGYAAMKPSLTKIAESTDGRPHEMSVIAALRCGAVLVNQTVLKSDHSPGCQILSLPERVEGAPNFREVPGFPVYGVANPTINGIRSVMERVWSLRGVRPVLWHNMREEPVIYINGKPFVIRELERPYKNMVEYKGLDRDTVEGMEALLKEDILREANRYEGAVMVIHETKDGQVFYLWEHVDANAVQTPLEVYKSLEADGFPIKYARVPITDGKVPKSSDFDTLTWNIASASKDTAFVFNCQMGRGRTTTGTVIACLVKLRINYGRPIKVLYDLLTHGFLDEDSSSGGEVTGSNNAETRPSSSGRRIEEEHSRAFGIDDIHLLWKITRSFDNGVESREALDAVIDRCSALQNIREAILQYRKVFNQQHVDPRVRSAALKRGAEYLERYFRLIAFAAYLGSKTLDEFFVKGESKMTFKNWFYRIPEVQAMKWSIRLRPGWCFTIPEELRAQHKDAVKESVINDRSGSILGKCSILNTYPFPLERNSSRLQINEEGGDSLASDVGTIQNCKEDSLDFGANISSLPKDLILMIVRFLSAKEAARVSVLSKSFQELFTIIHDLEFDDSRENLIGFCDRILALPELTTRIRNFSLKCQEEHVDSAHYVHVNNCLRHVMKLGVMDLELCIYGENGYTLPLEVFTCKTVVKLKLGNGFVIDVLPKNALLPVLETLVLDSVRFYSLCDCAFQALLLASPVIKELVIDGMYWETWEWSGILSSQSLERLSIGRVFSEEFEGPHHQRITFDTPSLAYLDYTDFVPHEYPTVHFDSLVEAKLNLHVVVNPQWDERFPYDTDVYTSNPTNLIKGIRNVKILELSSSFSFEGLGFFRRAIPVLINLHRLTITHEDIGFCWGFLPALLEKTPNLKTVVIKGGLHYAEEEPGYVCRCVSGYACLLALTVEVLEITLRDIGSVAEFEQVKHFLGKLPCLQVLKISLWKKISQKEKMRIVRDLRMLPRASSKCMIKASFI